MQRAFIAALTFATSIGAPDMSQFRRVISTQFIAADPGMLNGGAKSGKGADGWGLWEVDPGPRGVHLRDWPELRANGGVAKRGGWQFNPKDWWLEEHGLIMEAPVFPLPPERYVVTGGREMQAVLTVFADGRWELDGGATLHDVTHLPCRSARYTPLPDGSSANPGMARASEFPVKPGAEMPPIPGSEKHDYAVLFVIAREVTEAKSDL